MENRISLGLAKELKDLADGFENLNDRDKLRYFIQTAFEVQDDE